MSDKLKLEAEFSRHGILQVVCRTSGRKEIIATGNDVKQWLQSLEILGI